jgi:hypothetical protein
MKPVVLVVKKMGRSWWIHGRGCNAVEEHGPFGPYVSKSEAEDDVRGLRRFYSSKWFLKWQAAHGNNSEEGGQW